MATAITIDHPRVPLTRFHNNTGEFLDLASREPVVLTSHGREKHIVADSAYFRRLEKLAAGHVAEALDIHVAEAGALTAEDIAAIEASLPTKEEVASDQWARQAS